MSKGREVFVGLVGDETGWRRVLELERITHRHVDLGDTPIVLLSGETRTGWRTSSPSAGWPCSAGNERVLLCYPMD